MMPFHLAIKCILSQGEEAQQGICILRSSVLLYTYQRKQSEMKPNPQIL